MEDEIKALEQKVADFRGLLTRKALILGAGTMVALHLEDPNWKMVTLLLLVASFSAQIWAESDLKGPFPAEIQTMKTRVKAKFGGQKPFFADKLCDRLESLLWFGREQSPKNSGVLYLAIMGFWIVAFLYTFCAHWL